MIRSGFPAGIRGALVAVVAAAALLLPFLGAREIRNPDEPREAEIGREAAAGDWTVVPELNGKPFLERPPLYYWAVAGAIRAAGEPSDAAVKVPSAVLGIVAVLSVWIAAEVLLGPGAGLLAGLLLLGMPYFVLRFRTGVGDTGLAAFSALSVALFFVARKHGSTTAALGAGLAAGLAFLCKGLLGFAIPALVAGSFLAVRKDWAAVFRLRLWAAVLVGAAAAMPWVLALHGAEGAEGVRRFFVWNHLGRFGADADHAKPAWFYVCILWTALPLTIPAFAAILHRPSREEPEADARLAGICWILAPLAVLTLASGKRVIYLLPLLPGFALLATAVLRSAERGGLGDRAAAVVRSAVRGLGVITLTRRFSKGLPVGVRAAMACAVLGVLTVGVDAVLLARSNDTGSGHALSARLADIAGDRPLIPFRVGEGDIGQFAFSLRRKLPSAWNEEGLRRAAGSGEAVVFGEAKNFEEALRTGALGIRAMHSLRPAGSGIADDHEYRFYVWSPDVER